MCQHIEKATQTGRQAGWHARTLVFIYRAIYTFGCQLEGVRFHAFELWLYEWEHAMCLHCKLSALDSHSLVQIAYIKKKPSEANSNEYTYAHTHRLCFLLSTVQ